MPTLTPNYNLAKPLVNSAVDQDLWGNELNGDMDILDTTLASLQAQITALTSTQLPIGSLYINKTNATNPATLLGYGTWSAITDRFIIGASGTYAAGTTGGAAQHTLNISEVPAQTISLYQSVVSNSSSGPVYTSSTSGTPVTLTTNGGGGSHSILNPYVAAYVWERVA